jgi:hypothetical protein
VNVVRFPQVQPDHVWTIEELINLIDSTYPATGSALRFADKTLAFPP